MKSTTHTVLWVGLAAVLMAAACAVLGLWLWGSVAHSDFSLSINGEPVTLPDLKGWHWMLASAGGLLLAMLLVLAVPLVAALALTLAGLGLFVAVAALLLAVGLVLLIAFSPLWLAAGLLWWALRRKAARTDTMPT